MYIFKWHTNNTQSIQEAIYCIHSVSKSLYSANIRPFGYTLIDYPTTSSSVGVLWIVKKVSISFLIDLLYAWMLATIARCLDGTHLSHNALNFSYWLSPTIFCSSIFTRSLLDRSIYILQNSIDLHVWRSISWSACFLISIRSHIDKIN